MSESYSHTNLVRHMSSWVCKELLDNDSGSILTDLPESNKNSKPPMVSGFRPDLFCLTTVDHLLVIGEAKASERDLESKHSRSQYIGYLDKCEINDGPSFLVIAVPWYLERRAKTILKLIMQKNKAKKTKLVVLSQLPG